jgi:hypothetical protein
MYRGSYRTAGGCKQRPRLGSASLLDMLAQRSACLEVLISATFITNTGNRLRRRRLDMTGWSEYRKAWAEAVSVALRTAPQNLQPHNVLPLLVREAGRVAGAAQRPQRWSVNRHFIKDYSHSTARLFAVAFSSASTPLPHGPSGLALLDLNRV